MLNEVKENKATKNKEAKTTKAQKKEQLVYVGPSFGVVRENTVYSNGMPKQFEEMRKKIPCIGKLVFNIVELPKVKKELEKEGSIVKIAYEKAKKELRPL